MNTFWYFQNTERSCIGNYRCERRKTSCFNYLRQDVTDLNLGLPQDFKRCHFIAYPP